MKLHSTSRISARAPYALAHLPQALAVPRPQWGSLILPVLTAVALFWAVPTRATVGFGTSFSIDASVVPQSTIEADLGPGGMNCKTVRTGAKATMLENIEGAFTWSKLDSQINAINAANVGAEVLLVVTGAATPPAWMRDANGDPLPDKFGQFYADVVQHYAAPPFNVKFFEVYNEPNLQFSAATRQARADLYYQCLSEAWDRTAAFRATHPEVKVIGGVTAGPPHSLNNQDYAFFNQLWNVRQGWQKMDYYSFHSYFRIGEDGGINYMAPETTYANPNRGRIWTDTLAWAQDNIDWHGRQVWVTECGYDSASAGVDSMGVTLEERLANQARWEVRAAIIMRGSGFVNRFVQFTAYDSQFSGEDYGFRDEGDAIKPQYYSYKTLCSVLDDRVTSIVMQAFYQVAPTATTDHCVFSYAKNNGYHGWAVWEVPAGASESVTLGDGAIPADAAIWVRTISAATWTALPNPGTGTIDVTATNDPLYIEVRPAGTQQPPEFASDSFALTEGVANITYTGTLAPQVNDPDAGLLVFNKLSGPAWLTVAPDGTLSGTPGSGDVGLNPFTIQVTSSTSSSATALLQITVQATTADNPPTTLAFFGPTTEFGFIVESAQGSGVGGTIFNVGNGPGALRAGDDAGRKQTKAILTFDTSLVPDSAMIDSATLRLRRRTVVGQNPFAWPTAPSCLVDIKSGGFNGSTALEAADFQAPADQPGAGLLSDALVNLDWSEAPLTSGLNFINRTGKTQFRVRFSSATNDDSVEDYIGWAGGKDATQASWPQLLVTFRKAAASVVLGDLAQSYDGTPKSLTATTTPAGLSVTLTYDGSATPPTNPGSYAVVATINDPNYTGSASGTLRIGITALVHHAPDLNGGLDGSLQVLSGENLTLNGNAWISGDILVSGTPTIRLNGHPTFAGAVDGTGSATPSNYQVMLNGGAVVRYIVRRINPVPMPTVSAPPAPTGTRNVALNSAGQSPGDFATLRNLTLNGNVGDVAIPAGTYGSFIVNGNSSLVLGVAVATTPSVYNLQGLTLNGNGRLKILGPVVVNLAGGVTFNGNLGATGHSDWLTLNVASGGVMLNGNGIAHAVVVAPNGTVTINGNSTLNGTVTADRLTINGNGLLNEP